MVVDLIVNVDIEKKIEEEEEDGMMITTAEAEVEAGGMMIIIPNSGQPRRSDIPMIRAMVVRVHNVVIRVHHPRIIVVIKMSEMLIFGLVIMVQGRPLRILKQHLLRMWMFRKLL